jgi:hypothetical protein
MDREMAVAQREKAAVLKDLEVEQKERTARLSFDSTKAAVKKIEDERAIFEQQKMAFQEEKARLAIYLKDIETRSRELKEQVRLSGRRRPALPPFRRTWWPVSGTSRSGRPSWRDSWRSRTPGSSGL